MKNINLQKGETNTNTILIVIIIMILVALAVWYFNGNGGADEGAADDNAGVNVGLDFGSSGNGGDQAAPAN